MSIISKEIARNVANTLTAKKQKQIDKLEALFAKAVLQEYKKTIPASIKKELVNNPDFIKGGSYIHLSGSGWGHRNVSFTERVAHKKDSSYWTPPDTSNTKLTKLDYDIQDAKKELKDLNNEIFQTLLALKTYKRIEEQFPEAYKVIPERTIMTLTINVDEVRAKL